MEYEPIALLALLRVLRDPRLMRRLIGEEEYERREARRAERRRKESMSWAEKRIARIEKNRKNAAYMRACRARKRAEKEKGQEDADQ